MSNPQENDRLRGQVQQKERESAQLHGQVKQSMSPSFPVVGRPSREVKEDLKARAKELDRYQDGCILGFPGTAPPKVILDALVLFAELNPNNIGTHTRGHGTGGEKSAFGAAHKLEREVISMLSSLLGGNADLPLDGYLASGGTEANIMGLWVGRNMLLPELGKDSWCRSSQQGACNVDKICVIAPVSAHYSIRKACNVLGIGEGTWLDCPKGKGCATRTVIQAEGDNLALLNHWFQPNPDGSGLVLAGLDERCRVDVHDVETRIDEAIAKGIRKFIIVATAGTTMTGAFDPVAELGELVQRKEEEVVGAKFYIHVDAAFGGLVAPFLPEAERPMFDFRVSRVDSMTVDMHKMGMVPYPGGVFLCRKDHQQYVERSVAYISGHNDDTLLGSRPGSAAAMCWAALSYFGRKGFERIIKNCMERTHYLEHKLADVGAAVLTSPTINILAAEFDRQRFDLKRLRDIAWNSQYRVVPELFTHSVDECPRRVYRFTVMWHVRRNKIDDFIRTLRGVQASA